MFDDKIQKVENAAEMIELSEIAGAYRAPEMQLAGQATEMVRGWAFSGYDSGSYTFYYSSVQS
jgi:hypothetical protein